MQQPPPWHPSSNGGTIFGTHCALQRVRVAWAKMRRQASRLLSQREERRLRMPERAKLHFHLRVCGACTRFAQQLVVLREALRRYRM
jgi:hypothetical protein